MDVFLVFNELSAQDIDRTDPAARHKAGERMARFVQLIRTAKDFGVKALRHGGNFTEVGLADGYSIWDWLHDGTIDREYRLLLKTCITRYDDLSGSDIQDMQTSGEYEFMINGRPAVGLGYARMLESFAISLECDQQQWNTSNLCLKRIQLDPATADIVEQEEIVQHLLTEEHLEMHRQWLSRRFLGAVSNGESLYENLDVWFPHLVFIDAVKQQIREMNAGTSQLRQVVERLFDLEHYCRCWTEGAFDKNKLRTKASPESVSVASNSRLRAMREFRLPNGRVEYFEWHIRLTPDAWRLHFFPVPSDHKIYVGYIGKHLETAKHKF